MTNTQDDCRRAFERWYNDFPVGGRAAKEGLAWTVWQAAWSSRLSAAGDVSSELLRTIIANDVLIRNMRHRDSRWHDDHDVQKVLDANTAIIQAASNQATHPVTQLNVEELVREIDEKRDFICRDDHNQWQNGYHRGCTDAVALIRKWANKGEL